jgi:hypothetical protein
MREVFARIGREGQWPRRRVLAHLAGQIQVNSASGLDLTGVSAGPERNTQNSAASRLKPTADDGRS